MDDVLADFAGQGAKGGNDQLLLTPSSAGRLAELYGHLLGSMGQSAQGKRLIVVPDGCLARLPFEMLVQKLAPFTFALQAHDIRYIQSATVLVSQRKNRSVKRAGGFVGFGDPVYDYGKFLAHEPEPGSTGEVGEGRSIVRSGYLRGGGVLTRLPGSGREVTDISGKFSSAGMTSRPLLRDKARVEAARGSELSDYGYIHFSTHGILKSHFQALALTQDPSSKEDGFLTFGHIMDSRYSAARLVVLSACETGLGVEERGEGVTGLTRAVMYAGSPAVVVSLWKVDDEQTGKLMSALYGGLLQQGLSPPAALRQAKSAMVADGNELTASPFSWAAFVMYGE